MSLTLALRTALSGLTHSQAALQLTSNNVSNVNTEGYSRKTIDSLTRVVGGIGAGVITSDVLRDVDQSLLKDLRSQMSDVGVYQVRDDFYTQMQDLFGSPKDSTSLTATLGTLTSRLEALSSFPEDVTRVQQVIDTAVELAAQLNSMSREIQALRARADNEIQDSVSIVNSELQKIDKLNKEIARNTAINKPTADLEDQRDLSMNKISEHMGISYFFKGSGEVVITTDSGATLIDNQPATVTHTAVGGVSASLVYPGGFDGINVNSVDVTTGLRSGRIAELVAMRDTVLPNFQVQLDTLSASLQSEINAIHNDGSGLPPRNSLTGTLTGLAGGDAFAGTGTVRIAVADSTGKALATPLDLDLTSVATIGALVTAIDTGLGTLGSASLDANGSLVITATNGANGIVIAEADSDVTATSRGFSHHFGLNDFFVGDAGTSLANTIAVRSDIAADPSLMSRGGMAAPPTVIINGDTVIASGDGSVAKRIAAKMSSDVSIAAAGGLPPFTGTFTNYSAQILGANAVSAAEAEDGLQFRETLFQDLKFRQSSQSGVNVDEEMALMVELQSAFAANARVFSAAADMLRILGDIGR